MKPVVRRLIVKVHEVLRAARVIVDASRRHKVSGVRSLWKAIVLFSRERFSIREIIGYAVYLPEVRQTLPVLISKQRSLTKLATINPWELQERVENKDTFYRICADADLPIPDMIGMFRQGQGVSYEDGGPREPDDWVRYFQESLPQHFIAKDAAGVYGSGFRIFERTESGFRQTQGAEFSALELYRHLTNFPGNETVLQERLFNHPDLTIGRAQGGLCSLRVNTLRESDECITLLFYVMKLAVGQNSTDNFSMGTSGNLIAFGDRDTGVLRGARIMDASGTGLTTVTRHPDSGIDLDGYKLPMWSEAVTLAKQAHQAVFSEFGALGWDIALTTRGPVILEANPWWDPPSYAPNAMSEENWHRVFA